MPTLYSSRAAMLEMLAEDLGGRGCDYLEPDEAAQWLRFSPVKTPLTDALHEALGAGREMGQFERLLGKVLSSSIDVHTAAELCEALKYTLMGQAVSEINPELKERAA